MFILFFEPAAVEGEMGEQPSWLGASFCLGWGWGMDGTPAPFAEPRAPHSLLVCDIVAGLLVLEGVDG